MFESVIFDFILFLVSIFILIKASDIFTDYSIKLGALLNLSSFVTGVLIVAVGTSLPELSTSIIASLSNQPDMVLGNALGSTITNIFLGLGIAALFAKGVLESKWNVFYGDLPIFVGAVILATFIVFDSQVTFLEGIILLVGYLIYLFYSMTIHKEPKKEKGVKWDLKIPFFVILSLFFVVISGGLTITSLTSIAEQLDIGTSVLAASLLAIGTSLPEITIAIMAMKKGQHDLLVGNIVGSNIFNIFVVIGLPALLTVLPASAEVMTVLIPFTIASLVMYWIIFWDKKVLKAEGAILILIFCLFIGKLYALI